MTEIKWIKIDVNIFENKKIRLIRKMEDGDKYFMVWLQLLCLAGQTNDSGSVYLTEGIQYQTEDLSMLCGYPVDIIDAALNQFERLKMIEKEEGCIVIRNWSEYQSVDKMASIREYNREKQREYRARKMSLTVNDKSKNVNDKSKNVNDSVNLDIDIDKDKDKDIDIDIERRELPHEDELDKVLKLEQQMGDRFPSLDNIRNFISKNNLKVDPYRFINYYRPKGGVPNDWQRILVNWNKHEKEGFA